MRRVWTSRCQIAASTSKSSSDVITLLTDASLSSSWLLACHATIGVGEWASADALGHDADAVSGHDREALTVVVVVEAVEVFEAVVSGSELQAVMDLVKALLGGLDLGVNAGAGAVKVMED